MNNQCEKTALDYFNNYYSANNYLQAGLDLSNYSQKYLGEEFIKAYERNLMNSTYAEIITKNGRTKIVGIENAKAIRERFRNTVIPEVKNNVRALTGSIGNKLGFASFLMEAASLDRNATAADVLKSSLKGLSIAAATAIGSPILGAIVGAASSVAIDYIWG